MAMAEAADDGFQFLSDPTDRFPLPDLAADEYLLRGKTGQSLLCVVAQSSNSGVAMRQSQYNKNLIVVPKGSPCRVQCIRQTETMDKHLTCPTEKSVRESWIRGCSGSRTIPSLDTWTMKMQD
ncbi:hypothetical protein ACQJBY_026887 [Aegilops geniculata]